MIFNNLLKPFVIYCQIHLNTFLVTGRHIWILYNLMNQSQDLMSLPRGFVYTKCSKMGVK